jgi:hypothetical protein
MKSPQAVLFDFGDTIIEDISFAPSRGNAALFPYISSNPKHVTLDGIAALGRKIDGYLQAQRDASSLEFPWVAFSRNLYDQACP